MNNIADTDLRPDSTDGIDALLLRASEVLKNGLPAEGILDSLLCLKKKLAGINGLITKLTEVAFIRFLNEHDIIDDLTARTVIKQQVEASPFSNGYDILISNPPIIAEVKCMIPVGKTEFGAAQKNAILADIEGLINPGPKKNLGDTALYLKFMVLLQTSDDHRFESSVHSIIQLAEKNKLRVEIFPDSRAQLYSDRVYIVKIKQ
ncbi:MAG: hypothetical protein K2L96_05510 [Muribaculaceae bacterium]|nr:hypothetical protein [Muribaculaceae bacterium]